MGLRVGSKAIRPSAYRNDPQVKIFRAAKRGVPAQGEHLIGPSQLLYSIYPHRVPKKENTNKKEERTHLLANPFRQPLIPLPSLISSRFPLFFPLFSFHIFRSTTMARCCFLYFLCHVLGILLEPFPHESQDPFHFR